MIGSRCARMSVRRWVRRWAAPAVFGLLLLAGCESRPSGPGTVEASLRLAEGGSPGSAFLVVQGTGLLGVEGTGGTRVWTSPATDGGTDLRVLVMDPDPEGEMTFRVELSDVRTLPTVTVLQLANRDNVQLPGSTETQVTFDR